MVLAIGKKIEKYVSLSLKSNLLQHKLPSNKCGSHWSSNITLKTDVKCHNRSDSLRYLNIADIDLAHI